MRQWTLEGGAAWICGPTGSGKTLLLDRWLSRASAEGAPHVLLQPCEDPWVPVVRALRDPRLPGPPVMLPQGLGPLRRAQAAATLLAGRAEGPLRVFVDNVQELDTGTADVVRMLHRQPGVAICATTRRAKSESQGGIPLDPLGKAAIREMADGMLNEPTPDDVLRWLVATADGRPGRVRDLLLVAVSEGVLTHESTGWQLYGDLSTVDPARAPDLMAAELQQAEWQVLMVLAAADAPLTIDVVSRCAAMQRSSVEDAARHLEAVGVVRLDGDLVTAQDRTLTGVVNQVGAKRRAAHRALAEHFSVDPNPISLARHLSVAAVPSLVRRLGATAISALAALDPSAASRQGRELLRLCPDDPLVATAVVDALAVTGRSTEALELAEGLAMYSGRAPELASVLARAGRSVLDTDADEATARALARRARHFLSGDPPPLSLLALEGRLHLTTGQASQALAAARQGLASPMPSERVAQVAWVDLRLLEAEALSKTGHVHAAVERLASTPPAAGTPARERLHVAAAHILRGARRYLAAADAYAQAARNDPHSVGPEQIKWMDEAAACQFHAGDRDLAVETWKTVLEMGARLGLVAETARVRAVCAGALRELMRLDEAVALASQAYDEATSCDAIETALNAAFAAGDAEMAAHHWDETAAWYNRAAALLVDKRRPAVRARLDRRWAELAVSRGDADASDRVAAAVRSSRRTDQGRDMARAHALRGVVLAREGRRDQVEATLERALGPLRAAGASRVLAEARLWAAEAWLIAGRPAAALDEATRALVWADEVGHLLFKHRAEDLARRARDHGEAIDGPAAMGRLLEIAAALARERDLNVLLDKIADAALYLVEADRAFVILGADENSLAVAAARNAAGAPPGKPSMSVARKAIAHGRDVIVSDVVERSDLRAQQSIVHLRVRSAMCVPLVDADRTLGALYVDSHRASRQQLAEAVRLLRGLAAQAAVAVTNARLLAESRRRAEWAAEITHDIRSPLASVLMAAEDMVACSPLEEDDRDTIQLIAEQAARVMHMAEGFLADRQGEPVAVPIAERVRRQVDVAARKARIHGQQVTFDALDQPIVEIPPGDLDRVVSNLLTNALDHSPPDGVVEVSVGTIRGEAVLVVRDHGDGIPDGLETTIFERGLRATMSRPGHGLGLAIVRRVVEAAGGHVTASNHPTGGAEFRVRLPLFRKTGAQARQ
jgi:signal transduction histidine kinase/tetratricopeptide (TPR) repeat protein